MIISTEMKNGTKFVYEDGVLMISKPSGGNLDDRIALNDYEIMKLLRFITNHLIKL